MIDLFAIFRRRADQALWHKTLHPIFPKRDIDGKWMFGGGQHWRRWRNGHWEYKCFYDEPDHPEDRSW